MTKVNRYNILKVNSVADTRSAIRNDLQRPMTSGIGVQGLHLATIYCAL